MKKFEYKTVLYETSGFWSGGIVDAHEFNNLLDNLGQQGWELTSTTSSNQAYGSTRSIVCIFKRESE